jgi:hypothetical protein
MDALAGRRPTLFSPRLDLKQGRLRFRARVTPVLLGSFVTFVLAFCIGGSVGAFVNPHESSDLANKIGLPIATAVVGALLFRALRSATLVATGDRLLVRSVLRTRQWRWEEVESFEEVVLPVGASGVPRRLLRVHLVGGKTKNFTELNDSRRREPDLVAELVQRLSVLRQAQVTVGGQNYGAQPGELR